jgi:hypothetical protein
MSDWQSDLKAKVEILKRTVAILYAHELGDSRVTQDSFEGSADDEAEDED